jgi:thiol-disulfide isomerase/thioredoxin
MVRSTTALMAVLALLVIQAPAQQPAPRRTLAALQEAFEQRRQDLLREGAGADRQRELAAQHARELAAFAEHEARGGERSEARLLLAHLHRTLDQRDQAKAALQRIQPAETGPLLLVHAAELAGMLGLDEQRTAWIDAALARDDAPFAERMEVGKLLLTRMQELDKGRKLFERAFAAATTDEARAEVLWYEALATREREDLPDGAYDDALRALAERLPKTRFGSIATDRLAARELRIGSKPPALELTDLEGKRFRLADYDGKVLLLDFWATWCVPCRRATPFLRELQRKYGERGFALLSISVDTDEAALREVIQADRMDWRHVHDGKGWDTEAALRYGVESVPHMLLLGRDGKVAAMHLFASDPQGQRDLENAIKAALQ